MAGISRYEKVMLLLTAGFLLFCGGWFLSRQSQAQPYQVTVERQEAEQVQMQQAVPSREETPESLLPGEKIDLNTACREDLQRLPGIGEKRALDIVAYREAHGPFQKVEDIMQVSGIGEGILKQIQDYITLTT